MTKSKSEADIPAPAMAARACGLPAAKAFQSHAISKGRQGHRADLHAVAPGGCLGLGPLG
eukprot:CAMPEP_0180508876 /NCGR_PEP_ID=MMETSP1036_2-20121128/49411_1 /TAXON_ID=632150 /ORGANISM="Azadinium spinosum, Strain 3D9" /LENGTH=59 /DNA_ID=CAMNT_0022519223 /DNA_START=210 /DNA_END=386 /DNA_ORIENTATION=-